MQSKEKGPLPEYESGYFQTIPVVGLSESCVLVALYKYFVEYLNKNLDLLGFVGIRRFLRTHS